MASIFTKLGHRLSAQSKEFISANFEVQDERERGIAMAVLSFILFYLLCNVLNNVLLLQEIKKLSNITGANFSRPTTPGSTMTIEDRRKKLLLG